MPTKFIRAVLVCTMLALTGCIFSKEPVFDLRTGATDIPVGRFQLEKDSFEITRHGNLHVYRSNRDRIDPVAVLSFHAIGEGFYLVQVIPQGKPVVYGVLDARSVDKLPFTWLVCVDQTPADLVPSPDAKGNERCNATDRERLTAIANRYKANMMANRIEASQLLQFKRIP